jgi:hypothetical protein
MKRMPEMNRLNALLARRAVDPAQSDQASAARVLTRLAGAPLPRQRHGWRWPSVLLDFDFAPAWPRVAALAGAAALGLAIGFSGPAARFTESPGWTVAAAQASDSDFGAVSEPELLTGVRP